MLFVNSFPEWGKEGTAGCGERPLQYTLNAMFFIAEFCLV